MKQMKPTRLSVTKVIELVLRTGDIDNRFNSASSVTTMNMGAAAHRKIQRQIADNMLDSCKGVYKKEVSLKFETIIDENPVQLHGRADGILTSFDGKITIDEIKSTTMPLDYLYLQHQQHLGQGKCYAYMYMKTLDNPPKSITVQLTYFQLESEELRHYTWSFTAQELESFFTDLLHKYGKWLKLERQWKQTRNESIIQTGFPFTTYRKGQRELAVAVYRTIAAKKKLYASAPTGIGKTLSALFPTIKAMGEGMPEKIFYLTAKTITRTVAEDAIRLMATAGLRIKSITLRAKEKICPQDECTCNPQFCQNAKGHFDRINNAIMDIIINEDIITPDTTKQYAKKHNVCPHEFALDVSLWCDIVVGDYNHVFDPVVYLRRFFDEKDGEYVILIDEAHNLADRVRDMYTAQLRKGAFSQVLNALRGRDPLTSGLRRALKQICAYFNETRDKLEGISSVNKQLNTDLQELAASFGNAAGEWLMVRNNDHAAQSPITTVYDDSDNETPPHRNLQSDVLNLYFETNHFLLIADLYDDHYTSIYEPRGSDISITLFCLDPSAVIAAGLARGQSSILFSATLTPLDYYREILGGSTDDYAVSLPSPFDPDRLKTIVHSGISTKYTHRESSYQPIAEAIYTAINHKKGNYLVFFPSYDYMTKVHDLFTAAYPSIETLPQESDLTEDDRAAYLARFDQPTPKDPVTLVGFAVLGGIFSEGIDLKGDRLIGSIIISVGLPKLALRHDQIKEYFDQKNGNGYDFAYTFPGMNKVLQAAGRVIRTETDEGLVLLIDSRFASSMYRGLMPRHWTNVVTVRSDGQLRVGLRGQY